MFSMGVFPIKEYVYFLNEFYSELKKFEIEIVDGVNFKADKYFDAIMPGFTHLQIAQPVTFGHHLMAWHEMLQRDYSRLIDVKKRMDYMPLGSAALSGTRFKIDRKLLAKKLGFKNLSNNSMDAVSDRDFVLELASTLAIMGFHLSRMCEGSMYWVLDYASEKKS